MGTKRRQLPARANPIDSRFRELLEAAPDAIVEVDREGSIVLLNAAAENIFGYRRDELLGRPMQTLLPDAEHATCWSDAVSRAPGRSLDLLGRRRDGTPFPVELSLSPVRTGREHRVTAIIRDVTATKTVEEKLRAANQELEIRNQELDRASRLKSEFLASMSHELRTPLHTIIGFTELLGEELEGPLNARQKRFLGHVLQDSRHLLELINDILDLSKIEAGQMVLHPETFDASVVIVEALNAVEFMAVSRGVAVEKWAGGEKLVAADRLRFREILNNLLSNAIKFTPEGGRVWVEQADAADAMVSFCVADTGIGIAAENFEAIFDKFRQVSSTTRGVREGTGLGLAIVRSFVEMHGGSIAIESAPGKGSRFTFALPAA